MDTATKIGMDAAKIASKRVVQKTAEDTRDLIGNKIADKITSIGKAKEIEEIYIPPYIIMILDCFECNFIECNFIECNFIEYIYIENKMCSLLYKNGISNNFKSS